MPDLTPHASRALAAIRAAARHRHNQVLPPHLLVGPLGLPDFSLTYNLAGKGFTQPGRPPCPGVAGCRRPAADIDPLTGAIVNPAAGVDRALRARVCQRRCLLAPWKPRSLAAQPIVRTV